jgi:hypothetical protein
MNPNALLVEQMQIVSAIIPIDLSAGANNGDWVSMKNYHKLSVVLFKAAGTAGDDPVITLRQASDVAGTGAKALTFTRVDSKVGVQTATGQFTTNTQTAANTYTDTVSAEAQGVFVIDVDASMLDRANGFDCVQLQIPDVGTNAQIGCALYLLWIPRYASTQLPSAIVD